MLEWAEFTYYGYLALLFAKLFFPNLSGNLALTASLFAFAMSYVVRPFGALWFGWLGDRCGRRQALLLSMMLMGLTSLAMGLLPTYQSIGVLAPALLFFLRLMQGFAISGELTGAAIYLIEGLPSRPYFYSSFAATFSALGMFLGVLCAYWVSLPNMPDWAWRVPFIVGSLSCVLGLYIRTYLDETLDLSIAKKIKRQPVSILFDKHKFAFLKTLAVTAFVGIYIYTCNVWWVSFSIDNHFFSPESARKLGTIAQGFVVIFTPIMAWLADWKFKRKSLYIGLCGSVIMTPVLFMATKQQSFELMVFVMMGYALVNSCITSVLFKFIAELFPMMVRYSAMTLAWNIGIALFAGFSPLIAQAIFHASGKIYAPSYYVVFSALIALTILLHKNFGK